MKSRIKTIIISTSLTLILSYFVIGLYAINNYSHYLDLNSSTSKYKIQLINNNNHKPKLASLEIPEVFEEDQELEDWMLNKEFWEITKPCSIYEEFIEEPSEIEDWMINFEPNKTPCSSIQFDFTEKEWINKHSFIIL